MTTTEDNQSIEIFSKDNQINKDQRQLNLLNNPNYGIVLCFLEKFRSNIDLPNYSLQRLEDHLLNNQERIPPRLIDFHFILLKRLSLAKNTQREKFDSIITRFAYRFDLNDGDYLTTNGYLQADIDIKIRILKNLLEGQFDLNQTFSKTLIDKSAREIKSTPIGRDRFGVSYWLFMDTDCFIRLFREDIDLDRTWSNVAKNRDELEKIIKLLITDSVVRKKFSDWIIDYEPFSSLPSSNEFQECYLPSMMDVKDEEVEETEPIKKKGRKSKVSITPIETDIKQEETNLQSTDEEKVDASVKRKRGRPKLSITPMETDIKQEEEKEEIESPSTDDEKVNTPTKQKRGRPKIEIKQEELEPLITDNEKVDTPPIKRKRGRPKSLTIPIKEEEGEENESISNEQLKKKRGRPRSSIKTLIKEESNQNETNDELIKKKSGRLSNSIKQEEEEEQQHDEIDVSNQKRSERQRKSLNKKLEEETTPSNRRGRKRKIPLEDNINDENDKQNEELSVRRSSRPRKAPVMELASVLTSKTNSQISSHKKKRSINNNKTKSSTDRSRGRRKTTSRRTNNNDEFCLSSSSSDEHIDYLSEDEYDSDDYLPNSNQIETDENFFEFDDDNNSNGEQLLPAKTAQASTIITSCNVCLKSDRPEVLLLCDGCDDAYHLECLRPKLLSVPDGDWFCPLCEHKKLSNNLIEKLKELLINFNLIEKKRLDIEIKKTIERKIKIKEYTSDESLTASESEHEENFDNNNHLNGDESMLSISQMNDNSNISSSNFDESNKNISQRGRRRRTRFDMNKMLNDDESDENSNTDDDEYIQAPSPTPITSFDLQIPKKMTRLLNQRYRPIARNDQRILPKPITPRVYHQSDNLNEKLGSPIIYINGENNSRQIKSVITNSNQTLKIVRRWNDVQRRNKFRMNNLKLLNETTSDCADENSVFCPDDSSPPRSNDSNSNQEIKDDDDDGDNTTIIRSKITLVQPNNLVSIYKNSTKNLVKKNEMNFDQLTRDIQYAVSEANNTLSSTIPKTIDQQQIKRIQKTNFSPYLTKIALRPLPAILPKPTGIGYKIFKSKDPPSSTSTNTDLSNIILTPSSSSSLLDGNDEQSASNMHT